MTTTPKISVALRDAIVDEVGDVVAAEVAAFRVKADLALAEFRAATAEAKLRALELEQRLAALERQAVPSGPRRIS